MTQRWGSIRNIVRKRSATGTIFIHGCKAEKRGGESECASMAQERPFESSSPSLDLVLKAWVNL